MESEDNEDKWKKMGGAMRTKNVQSSEKRSAKQKNKRYVTYLPKTAVFSVLHVIHEMLSSSQNDTGGATDATQNETSDHYHSTACCVGRKKKRVSLRR